MGYLVRSSNYSGVIAGIQFTDGQAIIDEAAVALNGRSLPQLLLWLKDLGMIITEVGEQKEEFICSICGKSFSKRIALVGHSRSHKNT